ncbi:MAG TPA: hypothetical protein VK974_12930 [Methylophilaceae bacterium]|nr:hypothetical protein [Methylophilaceae bacterium]
MSSIKIAIPLVALLLSPLLSVAQVLPEASLGIKIPLAKKPTTRPMTVAFVPEHQRYYIADGGLAPVPGDMENQNSNSEIHVYSADGKYISSAKPGYDNRSIYYNTKTYQLETITYNISTGAGFTPNTGIFSLDLAEDGTLKNTSKDVFGFNPAFGDAATMPSYNAETNIYYAKQERSNSVWLVDLKQREKVGEIKLDIAAVGAQTDDISDHYVAYTGIKGEELALLDVDHKTVLIFDLTGKLVGKSALPKTMKLRAQNHFNGLGYSNGMFFVYHEPEGEFGTYYGFKISDQSL